jgi:hypothetical protein
MALSQDDIIVSHQLIVGEGYPTPVLKLGPEKVRGGASLEGPVVMGSPDQWPAQTAATMIGPDSNIDTGPFLLPGALSACGLYNHSPYSMHVFGDAAVHNYLDVNLDITAGETIRAGKSIESQGDVTAYCGAHKLSKKKNFDVPHPTKNGWRLRHTCTEAPYNDVYVRGKLKNEDEIILPEYWRKFVHLDSITVSITPIGAYQNIIVRRITPEKIKLDSNTMIPIHCFYHVFATRADGEDLIPEYPGYSPDDYPGNNDEYSINK